MAKTNLYPKNFYMSPLFVTERWKRIVEKYGIARSLKDIKFQAEREAWFTAIFLLGIMEIDDKEYWVGVNDEDSTPDTFGVTFPRTGRGMSRNIMNIEIFEWESHSRSTLIEAVLKKLENKSYPNYFILLCYIHSRPMERLEAEKLFQDFKDLKPKIGQIWVICNIFNNEREHYLFQLYPNKSHVLFDYQETLKKHASQVDMLKVSRGISTEIKDLGTHFLPLP